MSIKQQDAYWKRAMKGRLLPHPRVGNKTPLEGHRIMPEIAKYLRIDLDEIEKRRIPTPENVRALIALARAGRRLAEAATELDGDRVLYDWIGILKSFEHPVFDEVVDDAKNLFVALAAFVEADGGRS